MGCNCGKTRHEVMTSAKAEELRQQAELARRMDEETAKASEKQPATTAS